MALDEKSEDHQSSYSSSWGEHERLNHISSQSIQQLLRCFSLDRQTDTRYLYLSISTQDQPALYAEYAIA